MGIWRRKEEGENRKKITLQEIGLPRLIIIVLAGIFLLVFSFPAKKSPNREEAGETQKETESAEKLAGGEGGVWQAASQYARQQEEQLEKVLGEVEGVGKVNVMITLASSEERIPLNNETLSQDTTQEKDSAGGSRDNTSYQKQEEPVMIQGQEGDQPYIIQLQAPVVEGVVVVAQGAGKGTVDTEIIQAVEALFPIESHKIKVMKMN